MEPAEDNRSADQGPAGGAMPDKWRLKCLSRSAIGRALCRAHQYGVVYLVVELVLLGLAWPSVIYSKHEFDCKNIVNEDPACPVLPFTYSNRQFGWYGPAGNSATLSYLEVRNRGEEVLTADLGRGFVLTWKHLVEYGRPVGECGVHLGGGHTIDRIVARAEDIVDSCGSLRPDTFEGCRTWQRHVRVCNETGLQVYSEADDGNSWWYDVDARCAYDTLSATRNAVRVETYTNLTAVQMAEVRLREENRNCRLRYEQRAFRIPLVVVFLLWQSVPSALALLQEAHRFRRKKVAYSLNEIQRGAQNSCVAFLGFVARIAVFSADFGVGVYGSSVVKELVTSWRDPFGGAEIVQICAGAGFLLALASFVLFLTRCVYLAVNQWTMTAVYFDMLGVPMLVLADLCVGIALWYLDTGSSAWTIGLMVIESLGVMVSVLDRVTNHRIVQADNYVYIPGRCVESGGVWLSKRLDSLQDHDREWNVNFYFLSEEATSSVSQQVQHLARLVRNDGRYGGCWVDAILGETTDIVEVASLHIAGAADLEAIYRAGDEVYIEIRDGSLCMNPETHECARTEPGTIGAGQRRRLRQLVGVHIRPKTLRECGSSLDGPVTAPSPEAAVKTLLSTYSPNELVLMFINNTVFNRGCQSIDSICAHAVRACFTASTLVGEVTLGLLKVTAGEHGIYRQNGAPLKWNDTTTVGQDMSLSVQIKLARNRLARERLGQQQPCYDGLDDNNFSEESVEPGDVHDYEKIVNFVHMDGKNNPADILTKFCSSREWYELLKPILFWRARNDTIGSHVAKGSVSLSSSVPGLCTVFRTNKKTFTTNPSFPFVATRE